tara:strand:+ start:144 stop:314 length:171 start_codon:yes stop_codon:yes gene_type:complete
MDQDYLLEAGLSEEGEGEGEEVVTKRIPRYLLLSKNVSIIVLTVPVVKFKEKIDAM